MFNNPGGKIKGLAKVIYWIMLIIYIIGGIGLIIAGINQGGSESALFIVGGVLVIGVGILFAWLSVLFMYAFGSLVEDVMLIRERNGGSGIPAASAPVYTPPVPAPTRPAPTPRSVCPSCGAPLKPGSPFCGNCGTRMSGSAPMTQASVSAPKHSTDSFSVPGDRDL